MRKVELRHKLLRGIYNYLMFFLLVAFLVSCSMLLFINVMADSLELTFTAENIGLAAKLTFGNVIFLSILFTVIDAGRRKLTTEKITRHISDAAKRLVQGDFDVRIAPISSFGADEHFNEIIDCFNTMAGELSGVETLRTDFIANVSHEMKTPLAVMQNYGTLLQIPDLEESKRVEYAKGVAEGSRRLADMMTNILKLNKLEKQQIYPQMSLIMTDLSMLLGMTGMTNMIVGIVAGVLGIVLVALAYPMYNKVLKHEREKIAPEILRLVDELMK